MIRPLIDAGRAELRGYLSSIGQPFREDASNADTRIPRNRVRHELIPYLQSQFSPGVAAVLAREARLARQDEEFLHDQAIELARRIVLTNDSRETTIDAAGLAAAPRALSSRVVQIVLETHAGSKPISFDHVERVLALADAGGPGGVSLPGQEVVRTSSRIVLRRRISNIGRRTSASGYRNGFAFSLSIPGEVRLGLQRMIVAAEWLGASRGAPTGVGAVREPPTWEGRGAEVGVAAGAVELPLAVRSRRPGDRFRPLGAPGVRKLQDFFVDRKVARDERDTVPLVVDGRDRIVWVVGQSVAEDFRVTDPSRGVILLKVRHLGGVG